MNVTDSPGENNINSARLKKRGVKFICSPYPPVDPFRNDIIRFAIKNKGLLPFHHIDSAQYGRVIRYLQSRPFTGTCAILDLLKFEPKELHITGIDFYRYGYQPQYQKNNLTQRELANIRNNGIHKTEPQIKLLRYALIGNEKVTMDPTLDSILFGPYKTIIHKIYNNSSLFKSKNKKVASLLSSVESIIVVGSTGSTQLSHILEADLVIKLNLKRGFTAKCDIVFFNSIVERQVREDPTLLAQDSIRYIISFKRNKILKPHSDKVIIVHPKLIHAAHQYLRKIHIKNISSELFMMLMLVRYRNKTIYTAGIDLRSNKNRLCNATEEDTLFRYMHRIKMINASY